MIGELVCPDCGGIVGATETTEAGPPCTCFSDSSAASLTGTLAGGGRFTGTAADAADSATADDVAPAVPPPAVVKVCRVCGKDLAGHRRVKEGGTYLCIPCAKEEEKRENYGRVRCRVCGKLVKEEKLSDYEGTMMCPDCHGERANMRRQEIKRLGFRGARTREDLRQLYIMLAIVGFLVLVIAVGVAVNHFRH